MRNILERPRTNPGMERIDAAMAREVADLSPFEHQPGICRSCDNPAEERRLVFNGRPRGEWQRGECPACTAARYAEQVRKEQQRRGELALYHLNVPPLYVDASLDTFKLHGSADDRARQSAALDFGRRFVAGFLDGDAPPVSVFLGAPGTGKGHLVWSIAKGVAWQYGASAMVVVLSDVIRDLREAWNRSDADGPSEAERLRKYRGVDVLVIDEVSKHAFFGQPQQHLYDLVANREMHMRPTILTTNESSASLATVLGPALASRAAGWGACIDFGDADYRMARRRALEPSQRKTA